ncbi:FCSD flavin-binding domain-containing protein [Dechloromonas denitrificans]|uniref:FCSD flavin-binding domain-containing protein n=1 Tax=Dechloromonas denitrificans TaxID=281362 RepID=UPI001CF825DD|nr:FCSD flavin-binding domain-containing protein [Dechloromonas denitrificans]UCV01990.1 FCSD flavin-binding domain-containing protein [Dechloromonas denitrificans]UCV06323.1 FCSD flavin-binding domain-containing protein [Dechloromonas denitrificans]
MMLMKRRDFLKAGATAGALASLYGCAGGNKASGHVVVVGGGYGGATVAKYLRMWSEGGVQVTLIERNPTFISCPISNLVIGGTKTMADITVSYDNLKSKWGIRVIQDDVLAIDSTKRTVTLKAGGSMSYDRLVLSPGVDFMFDQIPGLNNADAQGKILHAWKAGAQTVALRQQLESMKDGGTYAISIPKAPYRCPPGPYERACLVADYFKQNKPKSKVVILDANEDVTSKKGLFTKAWSDLYKGIIEYRNNSEVKDVEVGSNTAVLEFDKFKADVLNIIPPHRAGDIAAKSGLKLINNRWVDINWLSMESTNTPGVHVLGDAVFPAPTMPKSGHMANQHGKLAAAAILNLLAGQEPNPAPVVMNTCYSFVDAKNVIHVSSVHQYDAATKLVQPVKGAGGVSAARNELEGKVALGWAKNIWADMLA